MKVRFSLVVAVVMLLSGCGVAITQNVVSPSVRTLFLTFVPPNEPGAPHDVEWILEHAAGDGGYYGTKYFPGVLTFHENVHSVIQHYKVEQFISANGAITSKETKTGQTIPWHDVFWSADWKINGSDYQCFVYQSESTRSWVVLPVNAEATVALAFSA